MTAKHTPGPWTIDYDNADHRGGGQWYTVGPAKVWFPYSSTPEQEATALASARLIASAPEMLEALKCINVLTSPGSRTLDEMIRDMGYANGWARRAIAKAEGRE